MHPWVSLTSCLLSAARISVCLGGGGGWILEDFQNRTWATRRRDIHIWDGLSGCQSGHPTAPPWFSSRDFEDKSLAWASGGKISWMPSSRSEGARLLRPSERVAGCSELPHPILQALPFPYSLATSSFGKGVDALQERKRHINLRNPRDTGRVSLGHPAGQTGVYRPVSQGFLVVCSRKTGMFVGPVGCPRDTQPSKGFQKFYVFFCYVPFLLLSVRECIQAKPLRRAANCSSLAQLAASISACLLHSVHCCPAPSHPPGQAETGRHASSTAVCWGEASEPGFGLKEMSWN